MKKLTILFLGGLGSTAHANAFLLNEFDGRAVGRGNAVSATDTEPSSIYYNVGGLGALQGTKADVAISLVDPFATFTDSATGVKTESNVGPQGLPAFFIGARVYHEVSAGIGVTVPFGLSVRWPIGSPLNDAVHQVALHNYFISPAVGVDLGEYVPGLSIGGGADIVPATIEITQDVFFGDVTGTSHLGASAVGFGGRAGVMYSPDFLPEVSVGGMWRSQVTEHFTGNADFDAPMPFRTVLPPDGRITSTLVLPQQVTAGAAVRPFGNLELEGNAIWTQWSKFTTIDINVPSAIGSGTMAITNPQNYRDTWSFRAGVQYNWPETGLSFRAGYIYDPTPIKPEFLTPLLPDVNRNDLTGGVSYAINKDYAIHLAGLGVLPTSRETSMDPALGPAHKGTYDVSAFVVTAGLSATLPTIGSH